MKLEKRDVVITVAFVIPPALFWLAGGDLSERGPNLAWTFAWSILCAGFVAMFPGWERNE